MQKMRIIGILLCFNLVMLIGSDLSAQFNKPYRVTYNPVSKSYLITNRGSGNIVQLDSNYSYSTVITGLTDPKDLAIGSFAGTTGLLVVDNNQIVVYDAASYNKLIAYTVSGAVDLEDIEIDKDNPGYFYLSDRGNNSILKGKVGPPPFYTPTYTVLSKNKLNNPMGLLFDNNGRLLVVTDTLNGQIIKVDTSNGNHSVLFSPGIDSLNHLVEDKEGNFYFTNWDDSYLYRTSAAFDTLVKLTSYNKPAGMYINTSTDLMLLLCHLCNKLEFHRLHYVAPKSDMYTCARDSFKVDVDIQTNGIGTYGSNNRFVVEMSDSFGDFNKSVNIASIPGTVKPSHLDGYLPKGNYGSVHKFRIRSTQPPFSSAVLNWYVQATPSISDYLVDSLFVCKGADVAMAKKSDTKFSYNWSSGLYLSDSTTAQPTFTAVDSGVFGYKLHIENSSFGCADSGTTWVSVLPNIRLSPWKSRFETCFGHPISIGSTQQRFDYSWSPKNQLDDSTKANPTFMGLKSQNYYVEVIDPVNGCTGTDSVKITVHETPRILSITQKTGVCATDTLSLRASVSHGLVHWSPNFGLSDTTGEKVKFTSTVSGEFDYSLLVTDSNGCTKDTSFSVSNHALPEYESLKSVAVKIGPPDDVRFTITSDVKNRVDIYWDSIPSNYIFLGSMEASRDTILELTHTDTVQQFFAKVTSENGCGVVTDSVQALFPLGLALLHPHTILVYPNPAKESLFIEDVNGVIESISLLNALGQKVKANQNQIDDNRIEIKVDNLAADWYLLNVQTHKGSLTHKVYISR